MIANLSDRQDGWREQLWTRQITDDRFEVACLPFFTYGICYRDVVIIDSNHLVASVVQPRGDPREESHPVTAMRSIAAARGAERTQETGPQRPARNVRCSNAGTSGGR
ncbi:DUF4265 domain-containing protein [Streptomyces sp. NPDC057889]|uniref:DUF4265 domain-containing protein n=1 Tax=unclassified Streptomyces TaxID=2593676 RepID=UPI0036C9A842